ncbi:hypothetical protein RJT34_23292 [Clitoria ternatea]|uniref:Uncharacterized protein n=1 Tax=Clitoria ternatea TaxID=43366 RepID=A0AAN9FNS7_CLITE
MHAYHSLEANPSVCILSKALAVTKLIFSKLLLCASVFEVFFFPLVFALPLSLSKLLERSVAFESYTRALSSLPLLDTRF